VPSRQPSKLDYKLKVEEEAAWRDLDVADTFAL